MSTKTSIKRIALVAVSALGFGLLSAMPSQAAAGTLAQPVFLSRTSTVDVDGAGTAFAAVALNAATPITAPGVSYTAGAVTGSVSTMSVPKSSIVTFLIDDVAGGAGTATDFIDLSINGQVVASGDANGEDLAYTVGLAAGTYSATLTYYATGTTRVAADLIAVMPFTLVVGASVSSTAGAISATYSGIGITTPGGCVAATNGQAWKNAMELVAEDSLFYKNNGATAALDLCLNIRNGFDVAITPTSVFVSSTKGFFGDGTAVLGTGPGLAATPAAGLTVVGISGDNLQTGPATINVVVTYGTGVITLTSSVTYFGTMAKVELLNNRYSESGSAIVSDAISIKATDASGNKIPFSYWDDAGGAGFVRTDLTAGAATYVRVNSSAPVGSAATTFGQNDSYATVATAGAEDATGVATFPVYASRAGNGAIDVTCSAIYNEKLTIRVYGYSAAAAAAGATSDAALHVIESNPVDFYCSGSLSTIEVTAASSTISKLSTTTVNVVAKDASGFPADDGTLVTLAVNGDGALAGGTSATTGTANGSALLATTLVAGSKDEVLTVTAVSGTKVGQKQITVGTGQDAAVNDAKAAADAAADAAAEAIDAANAATDAANLAAEAADAATVAAEEARDAADAATAAVEELATQVATLMAALKAQITTLANTVAKIAKKVKA